jgi:hypothetical protein
MKARGWAAGNGVALLSRQGGCAQAAQCRSRLDGVEAAQPVRPSGFVAARVAAMAPSVAAGPNIRLELGPDAGRIEIHSPLTHARELAGWLRDYTR